MEKENSSTINPPNVACLSTAIDIDDNEENSKATTKTIQNSLPVKNNQNQKGKIKESTNKLSSSLLKKASLKNDRWSEKEEDEEESDYKNLSLLDLQKSIQLLFKQIPPGKIQNQDSETIRMWAEEMFLVIEEFNMLLSCVSATTYKWGADRSGAADQNLNLLTSEINSAQHNISSRVFSRLSWVIEPDMVVIASKSLKARNSVTGNTTQTFEFSRELVNPTSFQLSEKLLFRHAKMIRKVVLVNFGLVEKAIGDYIQATEKDSQNNVHYSM